MVMPLILLTYMDGKFSFFCVTRNSLRGYESQTNGEASWDVRDHNGNCRHPGYKNMKHAYSKSWP